MLVTSSRLLLRLIYKQWCSSAVLQFRAERGVAPAYSDVVAARHGVLKSALQRRQVGGWMDMCAPVHLLGDKEIQQQDNIHSTCTAPFVQCAYAANRPT